MWAAAASLPILHGGGAAGWDELLLIVLPVVALGVVLLWRWVAGTGQQGSSDHDEPI